MALRSDALVAAAESPQGTEPGLDAADRLAQARRILIDVRLLHYPSQDGAAPIPASRLERQIDAWLGDDAATPESGSGEREE